LERPVQVCLHVVGDAHVVHRPALAADQVMVAAETALAVRSGRVGAGVRVLGETDPDGLGLPNADLLDAVLSHGISLHRYVGN
ncbi:MAG: hypothetical protein ACKORY_13450, partial [Actinomycetota bacterium]